MKSFAVKAGSAMQFKRLFLLTALSLGLNNLSFANGNPDILDYHDALWRAHPFYFGAAVGFGSTDWSQLIPHCNPMDYLCDKSMLYWSAPKEAGDKGLVHGFTLGYEVKPSWAVEVNYLHFPTTLIQFDEVSFYPEVTIRSYTYAVFGVAKFMTQIANTGFRGYANAGIDFTSRNDPLTQTVRVAPTFGVGINYVLASRAMFELGFQYIAGFGICDEIPAKHYIPFLYAITLKIMYRI